MRQDDSTVRKADAMAIVIQADREAAALIADECNPEFEFLPGMYREGKLDSAPLAQAFARHRLQALESSPADGDGGAIRAATIEECARVAEDQRADDWFEVGKVVVATGKRIAAAIRALTPTETGEQLFPARGKSPPADADAVKRLIAAVDAWIEDPDTNAEQEIMDARAALRGLGGAEG